MAINPAIKKIAEEEAKLDMTPLIDVTFLLLIFFLCTLNFKSMEGTLNAYLPKDVGTFTSAATQDPQEPVKIRLMCASASEIKIYCSGRKCEGETKYEQLYSNLQKIAANSQKIPVSIIPDLEVEFDDVIKTLDVCHRINNEQGGKLDIRFHLLRDSED